jgi:hypothetical protein
MGKLNDSITKPAMEQDARPMSAGTPTTSSVVHEAINDNNRKHNQPHKGGMAPKGKQA